MKVLVGRRQWAAEEAKQIAEKLGFPSPKVVIDEMEPDTSSKAICVHSAPGSKPDSVRLADRPELRIPWHCLDRMSDSEARYRIATVLIQIDPKLKRDHGSRRGIALIVAITTSLALPSLAFLFGASYNGGLIIWGAATLGSVLFLAWYGRRPLIETPLKAIQITGELDAALRDLESSLDTYPDPLRSICGWPIRARMRAIARIAVKRRLVGRSRLSD
jgi:hypothetical protein